MLHRLLSACFVACTAATLAAAQAQTITLNPLLIPTQLLGTSLQLSNFATASSGLPVTFTSTTPAVCTISGSTASLISIGYCFFTVSQAGNAMYSAATPVGQEFFVGGAQLITSFDPIPAQTVNTSFTLNATASSGLPVSFISDTPGICTTSGNTAWFWSAGTCTIEARQAGDVTHPAATPALQTFQVALKTQAITFGPIASQTVGGVLSLNPSSSSGLWVTLSSNTPGVCSISSDVVSLISTGTCSISASQPGDSEYAAATPVLQTFAVTSNSPTIAGMRFIPVTPCRVVDSRNGSPLSAGLASRFPVSERCGIASNATAYSLNVTAIPLKTLGFLSIWPTGQPQPNVSTLNSWDGRIKANAAIVDAGTGGSVNVYVSDTSHVVLDINGYFVPATDPSGLAFYPITPCRIADTRSPSGPFGGPSMVAGETRSFTVPASACNLPDIAGAYSLNFTVVPRDKLGYLSTWPAGQRAPLVSTLNAFTGEVTSNAAIVPAGIAGAISVFVTDDADVVIDVNGYFGPPTENGLSLYSLVPCRVFDSRGIGDKQPIFHTHKVDVAGSGCSIPATAQAIITNSTVVPEQNLGYLSLWPDGAARPYVSTLNAFDGSVTSNMAIIPMSNGSVDAYVTDPTHLILDASGYFAP